MLAKQTLPEVEILFFQKGMYPRDVVVRLFNPSPVFRIVVRQKTDSAFIYSGCFRIPAQ